MVMLLLKMIYKNKTCLRCGLKYAPINNSQKYCASCGIIRIKEYRKRYRKERIDKIKEKDREYYQEHKDKIKRRSKKWGINNPKKRREICKRNREKNKDKPEFKLKRKEYGKKYCQIPSVKVRVKEYMKEYRQKEKHKKNKCINCEKLILNHNIRCRKCYTLFRIGKPCVDSSKTRKRLFKEGKIKVWNKGLTKETDERVRKNGEKNKIWKKNHPEQVKKYLKKTMKTKIAKGICLPDELIKPYVLYCRKVRNETKKHKKKLFDEWNGKCYYTKLFIRNVPHWSKYEPTIDHKISKFYGFKNNILPEIIGGYDNLCICSRYANSKKSK